ncbi:MAG: hypothetical protein ABFR75_03210 [Acidobacteriota bacterium]
MTDQKKDILIFILISVFILSSFSFGNKRNYMNSFFGVYGKKGSVMGKADGSEFELWIYPYKLLHNYKLNIVSMGMSEDPYSRISEIDFSASIFRRRFTGESWNIDEKIFPALDKGVVFFKYLVSTVKDITIEFSFKPDLSPMWPASIGGKYCYWNSKSSFFVFSESSGKNVGIFGGIKGGKQGELPAHKLPGGIIKRKIDLKKGNHEIILAAVAGKDKLSNMKKKYLKYITDYDLYFEERKSRFDKFFNDHLFIKTPDERINIALKRSILNVETAFVNNPSLGEGLIAGYGLSGESERPGFGWYFGGDGLINSFALLDYGNFSGAAREIEFLFKYQRKDGKIMHELSQGEGFVDWFNDYGFAFFHGDTTLYFSIFLNFYVKRTGDIDILHKYRSKINKIFSWISKCDSDGDGIVETSLAGTGASETGPLRQKMKTDIFLGSLSVKAWESLKNIYKLLNDPERSGIADNRFKKGKKSLKRIFWNKKNKYFCYAVKDDNSKIDEITIWPAIGMRFGVMEKTRGKFFGKKIASPLLSTDWGTRFLSSGSKYYEPLSYNNGAVWPFLTGFSSLALYNYDNPYHAYSLLKANINLLHDFDNGVITELLSGDMYTPLDQSVPNQIWSSGNTIASFIEGLMGFRTDVPDKTIIINPKIPLIWNDLKVNNLKAGEGNIRINYKRTGDLIEYKLKFLNLKDFIFKFDPSILSHAKKIKMDGKSVDFIPELTIKSNNFDLIYEILISGYIYPYTGKKIHAGDYSTLPIIEDLRIKNNVFILDVWGRGESTVFLLTDLKLKPSMGTIAQYNGQDCLKLKFSENWEKKSVSLKFFE